MAPTLESRLVNKCLEPDGASLRAALSRGVSDAWFFDTENATAFQFVAEHHGNYGVIPSEVTFVGHMSTAYKLFAVSESVEYLLDQLAKSNRLDAARRALPDAEDELKAGNSDAALDRMREALEEAAGYSPVKTSIVNAMDNARVTERWDNYLQRSKTGSTLLGYSTGFSTIDRATLGLQAGHLVTLVASAKVGKTTVCLAVANHVYTTYKVPVLFFTFEMSAAELELRQESLMAQINFKRLQTGRLSPAEEAKYEDYLNLVEDTYDWPFHFADSTTATTVSSIQAQAEKEKPGLIVIDGTYMLEDEVTGERNTPTALTNITRSLKRMATRLQIPVLINSQALLWKMKGVKLDINSTGYSSSFAQDSDVLLGLERIPLAKGESEETHATEKILRVLASRNTGLASVELLFDYDIGLVAEAGALT